MVLKKKLSKTLERMFSLHPKLIDFDLSRLKFLMNKCDKAIVTEPMHYLPYVSTQHI